MLTTRNRSHHTNFTRACPQTVHSCGLAHCDIKPENIVLTEDGTVKLCDFGAAVAIDPATGKVAAMPAEITNLEQQFAFGDDADAAAAAQPTMAALTPYSLRKVTQARALCTRWDVPGTVVNSACSHCTHLPTSRHASSVLERSAVVHLQMLAADALGSSFGMAPTLTRTAVQGTDAYNAPERSNRSDLRKADVWALGCVLYELFTGGERLFKWMTEQEKYMQARTRSFATCLYTKTSVVKQQCSARAGLAALILPYSCDASWLARCRQHVWLHSLMCARVQLAALYSTEWSPPRLPANVTGWQEVVDTMLAVDPATRPLPAEVLKMGNFGCAPRVIAYCQPPQRSIRLTTTTGACRASCGWIVACSQLTGIWTANCNAAEYDVMVVCMERFSASSGPLLAAGRCTSGRAAAPPRTARARAAACSCPTTVHRFPLCQRF